MNTFTLILLAADKIVYEGECLSVVVPTTDGLSGILAHHTSMISAVVPGLLSYTVPEENEKRNVAVSNGLVKVENNEVLVLVDSAENPDEIDETRARRAADKAKEELLQQRSMKEFHSAQLTLARALNRIKVKNNSSKR